MLKKTAPTTNPFTGEERTEVMYFNFTSTELRDLLVRNQHMLATAEKLRDGQTTALESWDFLTKMVQYSYGKRTENDDFIKSENIRNAFATSQAYDALMNSFLDNNGEGVEFLKAIMPAEALAAARREQDRLDAMEGDSGTPFTRADVVETQVTPQAFRPAPQDHLPPQQGPAPMSRREARLAQPQEPQYREGQSSADPNIGG